MTTPLNPYDVGLDKNPANYAPLTPLSFLKWSARVCPDRVAVVHEGRRFTWGETDIRARRLASALAARGLTTGHTVATLLANTPEMYEAHFGVPMTGAVLNTLNTRLDAPTIRFMLEHGEATVLLVDREYSSLAARALAGIDRRPLVIDVDDPAYGGEGDSLGGIEYEALLREGDPAYEWQPPSDEWNAISLNYTSGTTGNPKGVVYHHRGAYLNAIGNILSWSMPRYPVYLWTLPMFHCNGWCFPWTVAAQSGTNVCLRKVDAEVIFGLIAKHRVTHYCGAPIVHNTLIGASPQLREGITHRIAAMVAGASPPPSTIEALEKINIELTHTYGLTEVYGPATVCTKQEEWALLDPQDQALRNGRQGVPYLVEEDATVLDPDRMEPVPADGRDHRRDHVPREHRDEGLSQEPVRYREGVRGWMVSLGRPRRHAARPLHEDQGPREGHHHLRRGEHLIAGGGGRPAPPPGRVRCGGRGGAPCEVGRDAVRVRRAQA